MNRRRFLQAGIGSGLTMAVAQVSGVTPFSRAALAQNGDQQRVVLVDALNLRWGPGLDYGVVSVLEYNTIVSITSDVTWADGYGWVEVAVWGESLHGWVAAEFIGDAFAPTYVHVDTDALNLRSGAGLGHGVIATYPFNTEALVTGSSVSADGYNWLPVRVNDGAEGWFAEEFLAPGYAAAPKDRVRVVDGPLNVRWDPGLDSEAFITVPTGAYGTVMDPQFVDADGYSWVYVQWDDSAAIGWVATSFLSYIDVG